MGMPSLQDLFGNLEEHEMELERFSRKDDEREKRNLSLKAATSLDEYGNELESLEDLEEDKDLALLSKKFQKILRLKKGKNRNRLPFTKKSSSKDDQ